MIQTTCSKSERAHGKQQLTQPTLVSSRHWAARLFQTEISALAEHLRSCPAFLPPARPSPQRTVNYHFPHKLPLLRTWLIPLCCGPASRFKQAVGPRTAASARREDEGHQESAQGVDHASGSSTKKLPKYSFEGLRQQRCTLTARKLASSALRSRNGGRGHGEVVRALYGQGTPQKSLCAELRGVFKSLSRADSEVAACQVLTVQREMDELSLEANNDSHRQWRAGHQSI
eukprot:768782-Hanusia_phi.AAC.15